MVLAERCISLVENAVEIWGICKIDHAHAPYHTRSILIMETSILLQSFKVRFLKLLLRNYC